MQRQEELLNQALHTFLERGFDQATIDEIASAVGMSKRTVYARYQDKASLFRAAVRRAIEDYTVPREALEQVTSADLEQTLIAVATIRIANLMLPNSIRLQRILSAQSYRFPELFYAAFEEGAGPTVAFLCDLFERHAVAGEIELENPRFMAAAFLSLAAGGPARIIVSGIEMREAEIEAHVRLAVRLFLNGLRRR